MIRSMTHVALAAALAAGVGTTANAEDLPKNISWTAYGTTSAGYANGVSIGNVLKKHFGSEVRLIPGKNDVSRMIPVAQGKADLCACGAAALMAQEGAFDFGKPKWGPQRLYNVFNNAKTPEGISLMIGGDAGIKTLADLKGKRMAWVRGAPALNINLEAFLAFAGLTWDDVKKVEFPGWKQATEGVIAGQADAVIASTTSPPHQRLAASPRGNLHPTLPHGDEEAWGRAKAVMPIWNKRTVSKGNALENNMSGKVPYEGGGFPYPIYVTYPDRDETFIYALTKAVVEHHKDIQEGFAPASGYGIDSQVLSWVMPYHPGAIRFYKEVGAWTEENQKHNDLLLKRQDVLANAWKTVKDMNLDGDAHIAKWAEVRAQALEAAGLPVPFRTW